MCQIYWQRTFLEAGLYLNTLDTAHSKSNIICVLLRFVVLSGGRDSSVGTATRYRLSRAIHLLPSWDSWPVLV